MILPYQCCGVSTMAHASYEPGMCCMWLACIWHALACSQHAPGMCALLASLEVGGACSLVPAPPDLVLSGWESRGRIHEGIGPAWAYHPCFFTKFLFSMSLSSSCHFLPHQFFELCFDFLIVVCFVLATTHFQAATMEEGAMLDVLRNYSRTFWFQSKSPCQCFVIGIGQGVIWKFHT